MFFFAFNGKNYFEIFPLAQDNTSCNNFIHCSSGSVHRKKCPNGLVWNIQSNQCDWVSKTQCGARPVTSSSSGGSSIIQQCTCPGNTEECMTAHPRYCNYFFYCINGQKFEKFCPRGLIWSQVSSYICLSTLLFLSFLHLFLFVYLFNVMHDA